MSRKVFDMGREVVGIGDWTFTFEIEDTSYNLDKLAKQVDTLRLLKLSGFISDESAKKYAAETEKMLGLLPLPPEPEKPARRIRLK